MLSVDGSCKFNHTCNHWVSSGKFAQCKQNHMGINCTNPLACKEAMSRSEPVGPRAVAAWGWGTISTLAACRYTVPVGSSQW